VTDRKGALAVFGDALGVTGPVAMGDKVRLTPEGLPTLEGIVDYLSPSFLGIRTSDGLYRFIHGFDGSVVIGHHVSSGDVDQREAERAWESWLTRTFA
jgi:hypothetical protein